VARDVLGFARGVVSMWACRTRENIAMRILLLMLAASLGAVACQKDQAHVSGTKDGVAASTSKAAPAAAASATAAPPSAHGNERVEEAGDDDEVSATDKSGVDNTDSENAGSEDDDSQEADEAEK
jgi:hypothetical protein